MSRPLRAGAASFVSITSCWFALTAYFDVDRCRSSSTAPFACLYAELIATAVSALVVLAAIALALAGRGAVHSLLGAFACTIVGLRLGVWVTGSISALGSDTVAIVVIAAIVASLSALWAWKMPRLGRAERTPLPES